MKCDGCGAQVTRVRYGTHEPWTRMFVCRDCWTAPGIRDLRFGLEPEWKDFENRHPRFCARYYEIQRFINEVVSRDLNTENKADGVIFYLGRLAVEDFLEVFLNAGNGYGVAGLKLLRPLFERVITMMYLVRHPDLTDDFLDYHRVHLRKTLSHIKAAGDVPTKYFGVEAVEEIEKNYQAVKGRYAGQMSWTKIDLATMAREVGFGAGYVGLCYFPTLQIHSTVMALTTRLEETKTGTAFLPGAQRKEADVALAGAHLCLTILLEEQIRHFGLAVSIDHVQAIYRHCWSRAAREAGGSGDTPADIVLDPSEVTEISDERPE